MHSLPVTTSTNYFLPNCSTAGVTTPYDYSGGATTTGAYEVNYVNESKDLDKIYERLNKIELTQSLIISKLERVELALNRIFSASAIIDQKEALF